MEEKERGTSTNEPVKTKFNGNVKQFESNLDCITKNGNTLSFQLFDLTVLIFSFISVLSDLFTDFILVIQYNYQGYKVWAIATFTLIFFPSSIVQFFSIRWHITDKSATLLHWICHLFMLGIIHRYILIIKSGYNAYKSKNVVDVEKVYLDQSDLCILHLFESFLESSPQLVLQVYVSVVLNEWRFWTLLSALGSLLSLSWAMAAYSKTQRLAQPNKNCSSWASLALQAVWNAGMLLARITTLVLGTYCFGNYVFLLIAIHWIAMTLWIIYQKTDFCETYWDEKLYNAVVGVIYCFCFFNLQEGKSRWRLLTFHVIIIFQNLCCLTIFLMWFSNDSPRLAVASFIAIVGGIFMGVTCMLIYYRFYHPSGPIKFTIGIEGTTVHQSEEYSTLTLRSLKQLRSDIQNNSLPKHRRTQINANEVLHSPGLASDSIIVVEESVNDDNDSDSDIRALEEWINKEDDKPEKSTRDGHSTIVDPENVEDDDIKRRAICSTPHLVKLLGGMPELEANKQLKFTTVEEAPSEILSAHDYENLAAVNIAREVWGLRSWKGYFDIETWYHDDSVVNDGCQDTVTSDATPSERSFSTTQRAIERTTQDDYDDPQVFESLQSESDQSAFESCSIDHFPISYPLRTLNPIYEEVEEDLSKNTEILDEKVVKNEVVSSLVATIEEITNNTPFSGRYRRHERFNKDFITVRAIPRNIVSN